jgi:hypothetical protein
VTRQETTEALLSLTQRTRTVLSAAATELESLVAELRTQLDKEEPDDEAEPRR